MVVAVLAGLAAEVLAAVAPVEAGEKQGDRDLGTKDSGLGIADIGVDLQEDLAERRSEEKGTV